MARMWSAEYWADKAGIRLYVYRKRLTAPKQGATQPPVLFLVHGSSNSGRSAFDLDVPGHPDYSLMDHFAGLGYDVWTVDHEGYGRSDKRPAATPTSKDKQFVFVSGLAHAATLGINRHKFWHVMHAFLSLPEKRSLMAS